MSAQLRLVPGRDAGMLRVSFPPHGAVTPSMGHGAWLSPSLRATWGFATTSRNGFQSQLVALGDRKGTVCQGKAFQECGVPGMHMVTWCQLPPSAARTL